MDKEKNTTSYTVRIPKKLRAFIKHIAKEENRSDNSQARHIWHEKMKEYEKENPDWYEKYK